jgi:hypothetical protein
LSGRNLVPAMPASTRLRSLNVAVGAVRRN